MTRRTLWSAGAEAEWTGWLAFLLLLLAGGRADATTTFGGGFSHTLTTEIQDDLRVVDNSQLVVEPGGWVRNAFGTPPAVRVVDTSRLIVAGGRVTDIFPFPADSTGVLLEDHADMLVLAGDVWGTGSDGGATGVHLAGSARLAIHGGDVRGTKSSPGDAVGVWATGTSYIEILGGSLRANTSGVGSAMGILADDQSRVFIKGGLIETGSGTVSLATDLVANGQSEFIISGSSFNYPAQIPISDLSGVITGTLGDGTFISYDFVRAPTATIVLIVPEPESMALCMFASLGIVSVWRRKRFE